ncbi:MAG: AtpZ/AtpI family protein [Candidatus Symbiobacter sp.]|nr:AtpZ/AtpI family protein [Candidatus Symbiobacter sp.]
MNNPSETKPTPPPPTKLRQRIDAFEQAHSATTRRNVRQDSLQEKTRRQGQMLQNLGFRVASDLLAGIIVGAGLGLACDHVFGTRPWGFILFFILGSCAGIMNIVRMLKPREPREPKA